MEDIMKYPEDRRYTIPELIEVLDFRSDIHENYVVLLADDREKWIAYGDEYFHQWAIKGYEDTIYYLKGGNMPEVAGNKKWYTSKTIWLNLLMAVGVVCNVTVGQDYLNAETQGAIIVIVNLILRLVTGKPLGK